MVNFSLVLVGNMASQIDQYDNQIIKMTKRGDDSTVFYNFWEATNGLGTLNASGLQSQVATGTIERLDSNACAGSVIRFKAYPLMNEEAEQVFEMKIVRVKTLNPEIIITESFSS